MSLKKIVKILMVMFLWAICFPLITAGSAYAPHLTFAALRALLAGVALLWAGIVLHRPWPRGRNLWLALTGVGLGSTSLAFLGMFMASEFVSPGIATVIANAQPLIAAVLAAAFLGERLDWRGKAGLATGFVGIVLIAAPQLQMPGASGKGIGYILLAALGITISNVLIRRIAKRVDLLMAMGAQMLIGAVPLVGGAVILEDFSTVAFSPQFLAILGSLSLLGSALAYWLWSDILRTTELGRANSFSFLVPVFGLIMGAGFFDEKLNWIAASGIAATLAGIALVNSRRTTTGLDAETA